MKWRNPIIGTRKFRNFLLVFNCHIPRGDGTNLSTKTTTIGTSLREWDWNGRRALALQEIKDKGDMTRHKHPSSRVRRVLVNLIMGDARTKPHESTKHPVCYFMAAGERDRHGQQHFKNARAKCVYACFLFQGIAECSSPCSGDIRKGIPDQTLPVPIETAEKCREARSPCLGDDKVEDMMMMRIHDGWRGLRLWPVRNFFVPPNQAIGQEKKPLRVRRDCSIQLNRIWPSRSWRTASHSATTDCDQHYITTYSTTGEAGYIFR